MCARNLNKTGKTALFCCFISSVTVVAQYTIVYEKENVNRFQLPKSRYSVKLGNPQLLP